SNCPLTSLHSFPTRRSSDLYPMIAKRRFGQNFLVDRGVVSRIIEAFDPKPDQTVMEIGPGRGALTSELNNKAGRVIAIEFDRDLDRKSTRLNSSHLVISYAV